MGDIVGGNDSDVTIELARDAHARCLAEAEHARRDVNAMTSRLREEVEANVASPRQRDRWEHMSRMTPAQRRRAVTALVNDAAGKDRNVRIRVEDNRWYIQQAVMHGQAVLIEQNDRITALLAELVTLVRDGAE